MHCFIWLAYASCMTFTSNPDPGPRLARDDQHYVRRHTIKRTQYRRASHQQFHSEIVFFVSWGFENEQSNHGKTQNRLLESTICVYMNFVGQSKKNFEMSYQQAAAAISITHIPEIDNYQVGVGS